MPARRPRIRRGQIDAVIDRLALFSRQPTTADNEIALFAIDEYEPVAIRAAPSLQSRVSPALVPRTELVECEGVDVMDHRRHATAACGEPAQDARLRRVRMHDIEAVFAKQPAQLPIGLPVAADANRAVQHGIACQRMPCLSSSSVNAPRPWQATWSSKRERSSCENISSMARCTPLRIGRTCTWQTRFMLPACPDPALSQAWQASGARARVCRGQILIQRHQVPGESLNGEAISYVLGRLFDPGIVAGFGVLDLLEHELGRPIVIRQAK